MKKQKMNNKGFTLTELLATIAILSLVMVITIYVALNVIDSANTKSYLVTRNEIEKQASNYLLENSNRLFYVPLDDYEYQCITVQNLIDTGYFDNRVLKSKKSKEETVYATDYIYVLRDKTNKSIIQSRYLVDEDEKEQLCDFGVMTEGFVDFDIEHYSDYSREKKVVITYKVKNANNINDYSYGYTFSQNGNIDFDNKTRKEFIITENGYIYGHIKYLDNPNFLVNSRNITFIDREGPMIKLGNYQKSYVNKSVTIPIVLDDGDGSGVCFDCFTKDDLKVSIGGVNVTDFTLTKVDDENDNNYNLKIDNDSLDGKIEITILEGSIYDKVVDTVKNSNVETNLSPDITFDNKMPTVTVSATKKTTGTVVNSGSWSNEGLNFKFTPTLGISGGTIYYCKDTANTCSPGTIVTEGTSLTSLNTVTGTYYVRYKVVSGAGISSNVSSYTAKVDVTNPTVTISATKKTAGTVVSSGSWSNEGLNFKFTPTFGGSGGTIYYCKDTANTCTPGTTIASGTPLTTYASTTGTYYIRYKVVGGSGISSNVSSYMAKVDMTTPTVTISATKKTTGSVVNSGSWSNEGLNFKFTPTLGISGGTIYYCKDENNTCNPGTKIETGTTLTSLNTLSGTYYIRYKVVNGSGVSSSVGSYKAMVDQNAPVINSITLTQSGMNINTVVSATDNESGINNYTYYLSTNDSCPDSGYVSNNLLTVSSTTNKTYYICVKVTDKVGNYKVQSKSIAMVFNVTITYNGAASDTMNCYVSGTTSPVVFTLKTLSNGKNVSGAKAYAGTYYCVSSVARKTNDVNSFYVTDNFTVTYGGSSNSYNFYPKGSIYWYGNGDQSGESLYSVSNGFGYTRNRSSNAINSGYGYISGQIGGSACVLCTENKAEHIMSAYHSTRKLAATFYNNKAISVSGYSKIKGVYVFLSQYGSSVTPDLTGKCAASYISFPSNKSDKYTVGFSVSSNYSLQMFDKSIPSSNFYFAWELRTKGACNGIAMPYNSLYALWRE